jgi:peptidoglycan/LPS O-acetylase OafA/YrhL
MRADKGQINQLDGMRALAIALVFVFHAAPDVLHGGYVGVDVFFVLSGYLITSLLAKEWRDGGNVNLKAFYARRAVRLYPALLVALFIAVLLGIWLHSQGLLGDELAGLTYTSDFWTLVHTPHFSALGQLWSLAVEEQFYLVWPLVLLAVLRRRGASSWRPIALSIIPLTFLKAAAFQAFGWQASYFLPWGSTDALMVGAALALLLPVTGDQPVVADRRLLRLVESTAVGAAAIVVILVGAVLLREVQDPLAYRGGLLVVALATGLLVAHVMTMRDKSPVGWLLGCAPARWAGKRSYSIYLLHLGALAAVTRLDAPRSERIATALVITLVLAEASWRLVESPVSARLRPLIAERLRSTSTDAKQQEGAMGDAS